MTVLDTRGFTAFIENLARISGRTFEEALVHQTGALLKACLRMTNAASVSGIVKRVSRHNNYIKFEDGSVISLWKKAGNAEMFLDRSNYRPDSPQTKRKTPAPRMVDGKSWHQVGPTGGPSRRWSRERWARYTAFEALFKASQIKLEDARKSRGLTKRTWLQIAETLGLSAQQIGAPAYVEKARAINGREYRNGTSQRMLDGAAAFIEIANNNPILVGKLGGARILQAAIDSRMKAFAIEMSKGVFDDMAARAKRYPGLFVNP